MPFCGDPSNCIRSNASNRVRRADGHNRFKHKPMRYNSREWNGLLTCTWMDLKLLIHIRQSLIRFDFWTVTQRIASQIDYRRALKIKKRQSMLEANSTLTEIGSIGVEEQQVWLMNIFMAAVTGCLIIGVAIPYVFQYITIYRSKSALGFSLYICLALSLANILRIAFWFGKRFEWPLLGQSVVTIATMLAMLEISVRMNRRLTPAYKRTSIWNGDLIRAFWKWSDLSSYITFLCFFTALISGVTFVFLDVPAYIETIGMFALMIEACLALPQLIRNFRRKTIEGMSLAMVIVWFLGDVGKTVYFVLRHCPLQFLICSSVQILIDLLILCQVYYYSHRHSSCLPTHQPSSLNQASKCLSRSSFCSTPTLH